MEVRRFDLNGKPITEDDLEKIHIPEDVVVLYNTIKRKVLTAKENS